MNKSKHRGYTAIQDLASNHVSIYDSNSKRIAHIQCNVIKSEDELKEIIDFAIEMRGGIDEEKRL